MRKEELEAKNRRLEEENQRLTSAIDELIAENRQLTSLVERDVLTGLLNRRGFEKQVKRHISRIIPPDAEPHRREGGIRHISLLILDIDHFKEVNDTYGHQAGDAVLKEVSRRLTEDALFGHHLREDDPISRYGGEEFAVVLPGTSQETVEEWLDKTGWKVEIEIEIPLVPGKKTVVITLSGGLTEYRPGEDFDVETMRRADEALYKAKHLGRNRIIAAKQN